MTQRAFFSTAGSEIIGQSQLLDGLPVASLGPPVTSVHFQSNPTSVLYQSAATPTFYSTRGSPFHTTGTFLPPSIDERKEYVASLPARVPINDASGLIPASGRGTLASVGTSEGSSAPNSLSHVQLTPVQMESEVQSSSNQQIIYEHYYIDQQNPTTSESSSDNQLRDSDGVLCEVDIPKGSMEKDIGSDSCSLMSMEDSVVHYKRQKQAEAARQRYQRMTPEERREANARRTLAQKRRKQREKEIEELEALLRQSKDIEDNPAINEQLREKRIRARRAEAARSRYQRMTPDERRLYNQRRRLRQLGLQGSRKDDMDNEKLQQHIILQNAKKAEAARLRYHRMTEEEKRQYNQRRTEAFRRRRVEEEILLSTPAGRISAEALSKAQQIMLRNARRAEAARLRYQRMSPEQRREYNQKRSRAKKAREQASRAQSVDALSLFSSANGSESSIPMTSTGGFEQQHHQDMVSNVSEEALNALERDVIRRTKQANLILLKQKKIDPDEQYVIVSNNPDGTQTFIPAQRMEDGKQIFHFPAGTGNFDDSKQIFQVSTMNQSLDAVTMIEEPIKIVGIQPSLQMAPGSLIFDINPRHTVVSHNGHREHQTQHEISNQTSEADVMPHLAELHNVQPNLSLLDESQMQGNDRVQTSIAHHIRNDICGQNHSTSHINHMQDRNEQSQHQTESMVVTLHEAQQPLQHQIIVTDLNQPTGAVLSSVNNHMRSRGRPPLYAAAAAALHQHHPETVTVISADQVSLSPSDNGVNEMKDMGHNDSMTMLNTSKRRDILAVATAASVGPSGELTPEQKLEIQRAKRAERARLRYHNMSPEERRMFNARRANALRKARLRDEQLCQLIDSPGDIDQETMTLVMEAQRRRAKRAEAARLKYHRMSSEERRQYNAMRDAQRRLRKKEREEQEMLERVRQEQDDQQHNSLHEQAAFVHKYEQFFDSF